VDLPPLIFIQFQNDNSELMPMPEKTLGSISEFLLGRGRCRRVRIHFHLFPRAIGIPFGGENVRVMSELIQQVL
jgi:hypothetical protein